MNFLGDRTFRKIQCIEIFHQLKVTDFPELWTNRPIQRFLEVTDQLGMVILSVIYGNPLLWALNLGIVKMSVIPENPLFPNPVLPKTSV